MDIPEPIKDLIGLEISKKRRCWKPFMFKYDCQVIGEIGVFRGENLANMIAHYPKVAVAVDLWKDDGNFARHDSGYDQEMLDQQCEDFRKYIADKPNVQLYREYSHDAAQRFPDEYFDLIYVDADHTYEGVTQDLEDWWPKIKKGRFFTGDDYTNARAPRTGIVFGVVDAVNDFAKKNNLTVYELPRHGWTIIKPL